jgi:hypothetical protein
VDLASWLGLLGLADFTFDAVVSLISWGLMSLDLSFNKGVNCPN